MTISKGNLEDSNNLSNQPAQDLRQRAEQQAQETGAEVSMLLSTLENNRLMHELQVHQIELEMQNDELRRTQVALEISRERLLELYEQAPVGYVTLAEDGKILEGNLTAAIFLGISKDGLVNHHLTDFIAPEDQDIYYLGQRRLFSTGKHQAFELRMRHPDGTFWWARMEGDLAQDDGSEVKICRAVISNVNDRKHFEEELLQSEGIFRRFFDNTAIGLYRTTPQGQILRANPSLVQMLGYNAFEEISQRDLEENYFEIGSSRSHFRALLESTGEVKGLEAAWKKRDGSTIYVRENARVVRDPSGQVLYYEGSVEDITANKQAQRALEESEERYRRIVETSHEGIWVKDENDVTTYVNQRMADMLGYQPEEMIGKPITSFIPEADEPEHERHIEERRMGLAGQSERRYLRKDGSILWVNMSAVPIFDGQGGFAGGFGMLTDISERKQVEQNLERERTLMKALMDASPESIYFKDAQLRFILVSRATALREGFKQPEELIGKTDFDFFDRESAQAFYDQEMEIMRTGQPVVNREVKGQRPGQAPRWVSYTEAPLRDAAGQVIGVFAISRDITDRKQVEQDLERERDLMKALMDTSPDSIYFKDDQLRFMRVSRATAEKEGFTGPEQMIGKSDFDIFDHETAQKYYDQEMEIINRGQPVVNREEKGHLPDGTLRWYLDNEVPIRDAAGQVTGVFAVSRDITELKQIELELKRERDLMKSLMDNIPDAIYFKDKQLRFIRVNKAAALKEGVQQPELMIGKTDFDYFARESAQEYYELEMEIMRTGQAVVDLEQKEQRAGQSPAWASTTELPLYDAAGHMNGVVGITRDITERKKIEQALIASEERLSLALDAANDGLWDQNVVTGQVYVSPRYCTMLGFTPEELLPYEKVLEKVAHPEDVQAIRQAEDDYLSGRRKAYEVDFRALTKNGEVMWIRSRGKVVEWDTEGHPLRMVGTHVDITQSKLIEAALRESESHFRALIDQAPMAINVSRAGVNLYANQKLIQLFGFKDAEAPIGRSSMEYYAPEYREEGYERVQRRKLGLPVPSELELVGQRSDGTQFPIQVVIASVNLSDGPAAIAFMADITERNQHERELEAIASVSSALRAALTRAEMLPVILDQIVELFHAGGAALVVPDLSGEDLLVEIARGEFNPLLNRRMTRASGVWGQVLQSGQAYLNNNELESEFLLADKAKGLRALAAVPLSVKSSPIGVLLVGRTTDISQADLRLMVSIADIAANAIYRAALYEQTERRLKYISAVQQIDSAISSSLDLRVTFNVLLSRTLEQLHADAGDVLLLDPHMHRLEYLSGRGFLTPAFENTHLKMGECVAGRVALERRSAFVSDLAKSTYPVRSANQLAPEKFVAYHALPLIAKGEVKGVLEVFYRTAPTSEADALNLLETISGQAAIAIDNAQLFQSLQRSNMDLILAYDATIEGWSNALDLRVKENEGHTRRVTEMAERLAVALGLSWEEQSQVRRGALLHDIGKMGIPDSILLKETPLTAEESLVLHRHPQLAFDMLSPIAYLRRALDIPYSHHERWDGTGYPRQLKGGQIPMSARIFAVVDVWDAITSSRPHPPAFSKEQAIEYIRSAAGTLFDPQVAEAFIGMLNSNG
jgi:PAS domain S-box-containing protein